MTQQKDAITKDDIPEYLHGDRATIDLPNGWTAEIRVETDPDMGPPWEEHDGHGPVSDWRPCPQFSEYDGKRAGERVLCTDRSSARYYDFAEAVRIARKDGWGCRHVASMADHATFGNGAHKTAGEMAACAAEQDFQWLRGWCNDEWSWVWISVTVRDAEGEQVEQDSLGGVESYGDYWRECAAEMVNGLISGVLVPNSVAVEQTGQAEARS